MEFPSDLKYCKEHTWVKVEKDTAIVGITDFAQERLGDIVYVELPDADDEVSFLESFGSVESAKSVSDLYSPVSGTIMEINSALEDTPEIINEEPYGDGWIIKVKISDLADIENLLNSDEYESFVREEKN